MSSTISTTTNRLSNPGPSDSAVPAPHVPISTDAAITFTDPAMAALVTQTSPAGSSTRNSSRPGITLSVMAVAQARMSLAEMSAIRKEPGEWITFDVSKNWLKTQDEHSLIGLIALCKAQKACGFSGIDYSDWAVVTASRFIGRHALLSSIKRFYVDGPWGASLHVVPLHSPHSSSGAISIALASHGPNLGIGSGPNAEAESLLVTASLMSSHAAVPGTWVVFSNWEIPDRDEGLPESDTGPSPVCSATAFAVTFADSPTRYGEMTITPEVTNSENTTGATEFDEAALYALLTSLAQGEALGEPRAIALGGGMCMEYRPGSREHSADS